MTTTEHQERPSEKGGDFYNGEILLFVLFILFETEHSLNYGEVSRTRLHMAWGSIKELLSAHGINMDIYFQDPTSENWKELDKTIFRLLTHRSITHGRPLGRDTWCLSLSPGQVKQHKNGNSEVWKAIDSVVKEIIGSYHKASKTNLPRVTQ